MTRRVLAQRINLMSCINPPQSTIFPSLYGPILNILPSICTSHPPYLLSCFLTPFSSQPQLSPAQVAREASWRIHPSSAIHDPLNPQDISQNVVSDCSVCAAITVCVKVSLVSFKSLQMTWPWHQRPDLITLESTPPNSQWSNGRHDLKILFNGAWRRVSPLPLLLDQNPYPIIQICKRESQTPFFSVLISTSAVDSKLPLDPSGAILGISTKQSVLWPSLVEKAVCTPSQFLIYILLTRYIVYEINGRLWFSWLVSPLLVSDSSS